MATIKNSLAQSHEFVKNFVKKGDTVIDATAGKGNDTVFLAELVGEEGKVYSFDIQDAAINSTKIKIVENGYENRVKQIKAGHQNLDLYVEEIVNCVMFNLGYLPGGDHNIGTKAETTILALEKSMKLLSNGGVISMVVYYGGDSGFEEKEKVLNYIKKLDSKCFTVMQTEFVNQVNCPPILVLIEKLA